MAIQQNFPSSRPSLSLNFARSKKLDPRITFTRTSSATYVGEDGLIKTVPANEARFDHDPETGESLGLLIEEGRSNLIEYSEDISNSNWSNFTNITSNTSDTTSPNGLNTATKLFDTTLESSQLSRYRTIGSYSENNTYTFSIFVKPAERDKIRIALQNVSTGDNFIRAHINLSTETVENSGAFGSATFSSASIIKYPNNWYRIFITGILGTTSTTVRINTLVQFPPSFPSLGAGGARTGDGTSGIYIWGAQLEAGAFPTSYIPTQGSTRTRLREDVIITGKNFSSFYNQSEGSLYINYSYSANVGNCCPMSLDAGTNANTMVLASTGQLTDRLISVINGVGQFNSGFQVFSLNSFLKRSFSYQEKNLVSIRGSFTPATSFTFIVPRVDRLNIGHAGYFAASRINGRIKSLKYYPKALPTFQLQSLSKE
jgi:hypothetical protein